MTKKLLQAEVRAVDKETGTFEVVASCGKQDRFGDTMDPKGWYLKNYKKNPVILWSHSTGGFGSAAIPPVAKAVKVWIEDEKELKIKGEWANTPFAKELRALVEGSFLNAVSVGFMPLVEVEKGNIEIEGKTWRRITNKELETYLQKGFVEIEGKGYGKPTKEDIKKGLYDSEYGVKFTKQELLEVSWVSVPALPQALVSAKEMNLTLVTKALEKEIKENPEKKKEKETETEKKVEKKLTPEQFDTIRNFISETEKAISILKELLPETDATPSNDTKGRIPEKKIKSQAEKHREAEIKLLRIADKAIEALLRKLRQK